MENLGLAEKGMFVLARFVLQSPGKLMGGPSEVEVQIHPCLGLANRRSVALRVDVRPHPLGHCTLFRMTIKPTTTDSCLPVPPFHTHLLNRYPSLTIHTHTRQPPDLWPYPPPASPHPMPHLHPFRSPPINLILPMGRRAMRGPPSHIPSSRRRGYTNRHTCVPPPSPRRPSPK